MPTEPGNASHPARPAASGVGRRTLLGAGAALAAGIGAAAGALTGDDRDVRTDGASGAPAPEAAIPFHGARQAGVTAPQQAATHLLALDLPAAASRTAGRTTLRDVLRALTRTLAGTAGGPAPDPRLGDGTPARLTSLVGVGPALASRLGLRVPAALAALPPFPGDRLDPARGDGDLLLQLCADDRWTLSVVAELATTAARDAGATLRWAQSGFLPRTPPGTTPRNLFGFKDGTANPDRRAAEQWVWGPPGPHRDGTVLVYRKIHMELGAFTALPVERQERAIGRRAGDGVPLTGTAEHDDPDIYAKHPNGAYVIPPTAHVRLSSPRLDRGARMLRRSYSYDDGPDDRGLLFCAFMRDPALFTRVQTRLAARDALTPFVRHRASAVAYVLPGAPRGGVLGERL
ncbi:hypothetical protein ADL22_23815 [Streptomyces sp. NRRL F-4489]|uniref:Dyp-type peroxidase n=1 Tax=Streptomyces sp. NRRL F-4489 TaxID=1609095 RepID=UPI000747587B|nr:Dyp-type peroxidase [Streptomyces sp. NRRL F-4489]KUL36950.1 hypothetical protein ADL22_23815 [Streptomyces sp. NRRL F-4489]